MEHQNQTPETENRTLLFNRVMAGVLAFSFLFGVMFLVSALVHRKDRLKDVEVSPANAAAQEADPSQTGDAQPSEDKTPTEPSDPDAQPTEEATTEEGTTEAPSGKVIYLTFDDGPGQYTEQLLDILDKHDVKVTFFLTNFFTSYQYLIKREAESGHSVAVHTYKHDYDKIYSSESAYWEDFKKMQDIIKDETGIETHLFRFPGGSSNTISKQTNPGIMTRLTQQANEKGLVYFDWNAESGDAGRTTDPAVVLENCKKGVASHEKTVLLCHDTKSWTVNAMDEFITWALAEGYTFRPLDENSPTAHHPVNN